MVIQDAWIYIAGANDGKALNHETLLEYCTKKRMLDEELAIFEGVWFPDP